MTIALLRNEADVTADVLLRQLAFLADAGWLRFEQPTTATPMARVLRRPGDDDDLRFSERVMLAWVGERAGSQRDVPLSAILDGEGADAQEWRGRYASAILAETKAAGMMWQPVGDLGGCAVMAACAAAFGLATARAGAVIGLALLVALITGMFPGSVIAMALMKPKLTRAGRRVVRQAERGPEGGSVPGGETPMPRVAPLPRDQAWSSHGGRWHLVTVPAAPKAAKTERRDPHGERAEVVGQVVRRWITTHWEGGQYTGRNENSYYCCIDDGAADEGWTTFLTQREFEVIAVGDVVTIGGGPHRLRRIHKPDRSAPK